MPGFLYTYQKFREEIETPIVVNKDENKMERLQRMIRPFILRRLKGDVLKDLPEKLEENVYAKMEGEQLALYDAHVQQMKQMLDGKSEAEFKSNKIQILAELTKLRQLCCDPALFIRRLQGRIRKSPDVYGSDRERSARWTQGAVILPVHDHVRPSGGTAEKAGH